MATYFHRLLNEEGGRASVLGDSEQFERYWNFGYYRCFKVEEVKHVIGRMSRGKPTEPDEISVEFWKSVDKVGMEWLTMLFNAIFKTTKMP